MLRAAGIAILAAACACGGCALRAPNGAFPVELPESLPASRPLAVIGDLQMTSRYVRWIMRRESNRADQERLLADLHERSSGLAALVIVGDLVFTAASRSDWRRFDALVSPVARNVPVLPAIGNHDYYCIFVQRCTQRVVPKSFRSRFPWFVSGRPYSVEYGDVMLAFLDSETALEAQGEWLERRLREWERDYRAVLIFVHRAPYTDTITRGARPDERVRAQIVSRLDGTTLVPVVVSGHIHGYEHLLVGGVHYVVTAGGGGPRGLLGDDRPADVYGGRNCARTERGNVLRPFNYLLIEQRDEEISVTVRGFCRNDARVSTLERFSVPLPEETS